MANKLKYFFIGLVALSIFSLSITGCDTEKRIKDAGEAVKKTFEVINESDDTVGGMALPVFVKRLIKDPESTLLLLSDSELEDIFTHEKASLLFKINKKVKRAYKNEVDRRLKLYPADSK